MQVQIILALHKFLFSVLYNNIKLEYFHAIHIDQQPDRIWGLVRIASANRVMR